MFEFLWSRKSKSITPSATEDDDFEQIEAESSVVPFGKGFREKYFGFGESVIPLNHGSFGAIPTAVLDDRVRHMKEILSFPDPFFKTGVFDKVTPIREQVAEFVDADPNSLVLVTNATTALNAVLRSYPLKTGDKILVCNLIYGACRNTIRFLQDRIGVEVVEVKIEYPMSHDEILETFSNAMDSNDNVKMAFFDSVSSMPAAIIPWERLCQECRDRNILSVVDGAHGIGLIPISLSKARPDFFTSNLHKWLFAPNSVALLYVDKSHHHYIHSLPISAVYLDDNETLAKSKEKTRFVDTFLYTGTMDYSAILTIPDSIRFRKQICGGEEAIREYCVDLATRGGALVAKEFGTEVMSGKEDNIITSMVNVLVPFDCPCNSAVQGEIVDKFNRYILEEWNAFVAIGYYNDQWWSRWSAQIYLDIDDFKYGIRAVLNTIEFLKSEGYGK